MFGRKLITMGRKITFGSHELINNNADGSQQDGIATTSRGPYDAAILITPQQKHHHSRRDLQSSTRWEAVPEK